MKRISLLLAFVAFFGLASFANTKEIKKVGLKQITTASTKVLKAQEIKVYCNGTYAGSFTCESCTVQQIINIASSFCN